MQNTHSLPIWFPFYNALRRRPLFFILLFLIGLWSLIIQLPAIQKKHASNQMASLDQKKVQISGDLQQIDEKNLYLKAEHGIILIDLSSLKLSEEIGDSYQTNKTSIACFPTDSLPDASLEDDSLTDDQILPFLGCTLQISGNFSLFAAATNPGEFDARSYYDSLQIGGKMKDCVLESVSKSAPLSAFSPLKRLYCMLLRFLQKCKNTWKNRLNSIFPAPESSIMCTLLLGCKSELDPSIRTLYQSAGISHILSISSLHISILGMGLYKLLRKIFLPSRLAAILASLFLFFYVLMTGMSISAVRSLLLFLLSMLAVLIRRTPDALTGCGLAATFLLLNNPFLLENSGFLLSFSCLLGILVLYPLLEKYRFDALTSFEREHDAILPMQTSRFPFIKHASDRFASNLHTSDRFIFSCHLSLRKLFLKYILKAILPGFCIQITTLPIMLCTFYEIPKYSLFINLLILPFLSLLLFCGLLAMLLPGFGFLGTGSYLILKGYETICNLCSSLPNAFWNPGHPSSWQILLFWSLWLLPLFWDTLLPYLQATNPKESLSPTFSFFARIRLVASACYRLVLPSPLHRLLLYLLLLPILFCPPKAQKNTLTFLDVGQGDCIIYVTEHKQVLLFDGGSSSRSQIGNYVIKPYLKYYGLSHITSLYISHPDADHVNGLLELLTNREKWGLKIDQVFASPILFESHSEEAQKICESFPHIQILTAGKQLIYADNVANDNAADDNAADNDATITCLHPSADFSAKDANAGSLCLLLQAKNHTVLLTGDIHGEGERNLEEALLAYMHNSQIKEIDILKVAHHGSKYSSYDSFLEIVSPQIAIISAGRNNRYGHPHKDTLKRLQAFGCTIFSTQKIGAISLHLE